jgi:hypothetical protein
MRVFTRFQCVILPAILMLGTCKIVTAQAVSPTATQPASQATSQPGDTLAPDTIARELASAKAQHQEAIGKAKKALLDVINKRINEAANAGNLATVQSLQAVRATAAVDGTVPYDVKDTVILVAKTNYETAIASARARLDRAYRKAVRDYTRARRFDEARSTQDELNSLVLVDPTMAPRVVDLLQLVDVTRDALSGHWHLEGGKLSNERSNVTQIRFPYRPPSEYDFHLVYDRENADWGIELGVCRLDHVFGCGMPDLRDVAANGNFFGLEESRYPAPAGAATHCDVCVQVRNDRLTIIINGEKAFDHPMATWEFGKTPGWFAGPEAFGLGLIDWWGRTTITKAEVREISGPGKVLGRGN